MTVILIILCIYTYKLRKLWEKNRLQPQFGHAYHLTLITCFIVKWVHRGKCPIKAHLRCLMISKRNDISINTGWLTMYTLKVVASHLCQPRCMWYYRISVACDIVEFEFIVLSPSLVWSTSLGLPKRCDICMHQHVTSDIRRRNMWHSTYWHMKQYKGVGCINDIKFVI